MKIFRLLGAIFVENRDVIIVGGGPGGLSAAVYARRAGLKVLVLERGVFGGAITSTSEVENYPALVKVTGPELGKMFYDQAKGLGTEFKVCIVKGLKLEGMAKVVLTDHGDFSAKVVIIASGAVFRKLGCPGESKFAGNGVSYCATCDGPFYRGAEIAVVGGGNTAVEEGCYLTEFASKVYIIHRRDQFRADHLAVERMMANPKIVPVYDSVVESIQGSDLVEKIVVKNVKTGVTKELPVEGVFMFVGVEPNSQFAQGVVEMVHGGWIKTDTSMQTSVPGIFAVGDVRDTVLRQVITAASDGAIAGEAAYKYIAANS